MGEVPYVEVILEAVRRTQVARVLVEGISPKHAPTTLGSRPGRAVRGCSAVAIIPTLLDPRRGIADQVEKTEGVLKSGLSFGRGDNMLISIAEHGLGEGYSENYALLAVTGGRDTAFVYWAGEALPRLRSRMEVVAGTNEDRQTRSSAPAWRIDG